MHLKDIAMKTKEDLSGGAPEGASVVLGQGELDWKEILRAARNSSIRAYLIEDESPNAATQVPQSMSYLREIEF